MTQQEENQKKLTENRSYLISAYAEGKGCYVLGRELGVHRTVVRRFLIKCGVTLDQQIQHAALHKKFKESRDYLIGAYASGKTATGLAMEMGCSLVTMLKFLKEQGVKIKRNRTHRSDQQRQKHVEKTFTAAEIAQIKILHHRGLTRKQIAQKLSLSLIKVSKLLMRLNLKPNRPKSF